MRLNYTILAIFACITLISLAYITRHFCQSHHAKSVERAAVFAYEKINTTPIPETGTDTLNERERLLAIEQARRELFAELLEQNADFRGFIEIPELDILLPYVQTNNNETYLNTAFDGTANPVGTIFLDSLNDPLLLDRNNVLHGHNMKNGTMFGDLYLLKNPEYFGREPIIILDSLTGKTAWLIFAAYVCEADINIIQTTFTLAGFAEYLNGIKARNMHMTDIEINPEIARILTLSTCSYEFPDARFIVHAVKQW